MGGREEESNSGRREADVNSPVHNRSRPQTEGSSLEAKVLVCYESIVHSGDLSTVEIVHLGYREYKCDGPGLKENRTTRINVL